MTLYKPGQGMAARVGAIGLGALLAFYAAYCWYWWLFPETERLLDRLLSAGFLGGILLFLALAAGSLWLPLFQPRAVDYLIDMDGELRKVVWPAAAPLFDPQAEAWGSTYVVIGFTIMLTALIGIIDWGMHHAISMGLLKLLFGTQGI